MSKKILATYRDNPGMADIAKADALLLDELTQYLKDKSAEVNAHIHTITKKHIEYCERALDLATTIKLLPPDINPRQISVAFGPPDDGVYYRTLKEPKSLEETYAQADKIEYVIMQKPHPIASALMEALS